MFAGLGTSADSPLFRAAPGPLSADQTRAALNAAVLAQLPLLDLFAADRRVATGSATDADADVDVDVDVDVDELYTLVRVEVSQATGALVVQLGLHPAQALARLRAHAHTTGRSITAVARDVVDRKLRLEP